MTEKYKAAEHHAAAAIHHQQAAQHHHEASRHFEIGKDYAHAAHQALIAHGHALHAMSYGNKASNSYVKHADAALPVPPIPEEEPTTTGTIQPNLSGVEHHAAAARHHEQAARHHSQASRHCDEKEDALAAHEAQIAQGYAQHSVFHGEEAMKHHAEHYGKSGPSAEIV